MDPRLLKLMGSCVYMTPFDDERGGGGGDGDEEEDFEEGDEESEADEVEESEADEESEGDEDEESEADEDEESESEEDDLDEQLGQRAQKRIKKLNARAKDAERRVKELESELEEARKLGGDSGEVYAAAIEKAGLLPRLVTKDLAEGLKKIDQKKSALGYFGTLLDSDEDEFEIGGKTYSRRQIERKERALNDEVRELESKFGGKRDKMQAEIRSLFELGLAAQKAGWKPGKKAKETKPVTKDKPGSRKIRKPDKKAERSRSLDEINSDDDLEAEIMAMNRGKRK